VSKNVTLSLPENVALWVRMKAARDDTSVSGYLSALLQERMRNEEQYDSAYQQWRRGKPIAGVDAAKRMSRDAAHER
jgi:hypothetical protein